MLEYNLQYFAKDGEGGEKTEEPTAKKLEDARKKGQVAKSKELPSAIMLLGLFLTLKVYIGKLGEGFMGVFKLFFNKIPDYAGQNVNQITNNSCAGMMSNVLIQILLWSSPFFLLSVVLAIVTNVMQVKWKITGEPIKPKFSKLNPISGFKKIFSTRSLFEFIKSIAKVGFLAYVAYSTLKDKAGVIKLFYEIPLNSALSLIGDIIIDVGIKMSVLYLIVGLADFAYEKYKFKDEMKMTKQEVKDEYKNSEGDPQIKGKIRQRMREASRRRMMQAVPEADVVITNPTHFAVAIKYDADTQKAPVVIAKGADYLAQRIKETARENKIEIVENKPLARMLYNNVDIDQEIPPELYQAVAEVLAFVYNLKEKELKQSELKEGGSGYGNQKNRCWRRYIYISRSCILDYSIAK